MDSDSLRDHIGKILSAIVTDMNAPQTERERSEKSKGHALRHPLMGDSPAETHGGLREASGFSVEQAAAEYRALRAVVIKLWFSTSPALGPPQVEELMRFNEAMDAALADTLMEFAAASARSRNIFLGVLSHELRTPLGTIVGSAQVLLQMANQNPTVNETSYRILRGGKRIQSILDDLLDYVRSGVNGGMRVSLAETRLDELCNRVAREVESAFPGRIVAVNHEGNLVGFWDEQRIAQAVSNLMSNAIKYGQDNAAISVNLRGEALDEVSIEVHNRGPEISVDTLESLFQPLVRGTGPDATGFSLGLGLFIVREIAAAHGGSVEVSSSNNQGTTFRILLPRDSRPARRPAFGGLRRT
jgi:signal transduction histidine kinase